MNTATLISPLGNATTVEVIATAKATDDVTVGVFRLASGEYFPGLYTGTHAVRRDDDMTEAEARTVANSLYKAAKAEEYRIRNWSYANNTPANCRVIGAA